MTTLRSRFWDTFGDWHRQLPAAWRRRLSQVELDFDGVPKSLTLGDNERIWPVKGNPGAPKRADVFRALRDVGPEDVRVVVFGNDPYTRVAQATGRSFDQGDLTSWKKDAGSPGKISPSLASILCAAIADAHPDLEAEYQLLDARPRYSMLEDWDRRQDWYAHAGLSRLIEDGAMPLASPSMLFRRWASQGVLWLNRTLTFTKWDDEQRGAHTTLWAPFTGAVLELLASAPGASPVVFALWGGRATPLADEIRAAAKRYGAGVRVVIAGHPQLPSGYFGRGNPLSAINREIKSAPIDWAPKN